MQRKAIYTHTAKEGHDAGPRWMERHSIGSSPGASRGMSRSNVSFFSLLREGKGNHRPSRCWRDPTRLVCLSAGGHLSLSSNVVVFLHKKPPPTLAHIAVVIRRVGHTEPDVLSPHHGVGIGSPRSTQVNRRNDVPRLHRSSLSLFSLPLSALPAPPSLV